MILHSTPIAGVVVLEADPIRDERGFFVRLHSAADFAAQGLPPVFGQTAISHNRLKGTLRGLHFQRHPMAEAKLVRCISGAIFDAVVDMRAESPTFGKSFSMVLEAARSERGLYLPAGMAHGFQSLADDSSVLYQIDGSYSPQHEAGVRWDDPDLAIAWPLTPTSISQRDRELPLLNTYRPGRGNADR